MRRTEEQSNKSNKNIQNNAKNATTSFSGLKSQLLAVKALMASGLGFKSWIVDTITQAASLERMSQILGMGKVNLAEWGNATKAAGGNAADAQIAIENVTTALGEFNKSGQYSGLISSMAEQAAYGRVAFKMPVRGVTTQQEMMGQMADIIAGVKQTQGESAAVTTAKKMGITSPAMFLMMEQGSRHLNELLDATKDLSKAQSDAAPAAEQLRKDLVNVSQLFDKFGTTLLTEALPGLTKFADWLNSPDFQKSLDFLGKEINWVGHLFDVVGKSIGNFFGWLNVGPIPKQAADIKSMPQGSSGSWGIPASTVATAGSKSAKGAESAIMAQLQAAGYTQAQAAGIVGNLRAESELNPNMPGGQGSYGLAQWRGSRLDDFKKVMGRDIQGSSLQDQVKFLIYELQQGSKKKVGARLSKTTTPEQAAMLISDQYEIPYGPTAHNAMRMSYARNAMAAGGNTTTSTTHIDKVIVNTQATDAHGIAGAIKQNLQGNLNMGVGQANRGLS